MKFTRLALVTEIHDNNGSEGSERVTWTGSHVLPRGPEVTCDGETRGPQASTRVRPCQLVVTSDLRPPGPSSCGCPHV